LQGIKPGIEVIFTGGYAEEAESLVKLEKRAMFLQKPYDLAKLSQMIRNAISRQRSTAQATGNVEA
jgi:DNA-binding NtrC family response regulator